jgi:hypothetical protein
MTQDGTPRELPKLPQARRYLRSAQWGFDELLAKQLSDTAFVFYLVGILASLRAVQHSLKRASLSRPSGEWRVDDFDVPEGGVNVLRCPLGENSCGAAIMLLIIWYLALVAAGDALAYLVGLFVEYEFGSYPSMLAFLVLYFVVLWGAWIIAVRVTGQPSARRYRE